MYNNIQTHYERKEKMDLNQLRNDIDKLDKEILSAFEKRMDLCRQVALYKKENNLPIFQEGREKEIIKKVRDRSPEHLKDGSAALFTEIMDISKCLQQQELLKEKDFIRPIPLNMNCTGKIGCQGTSGSNSEAAARKLFSENEIVFYQEFEDVFEAVEKGDIQFGIIPIHNSTAVMYQLVVRKCPCAPSTMIVKSSSGATSCGSKLTSPSPSIRTVPP